MPDDAERRRLLTDIDDDLEAVEQALARLDEGTYSSCEVCGDPIDDELLARSPGRRRCDVHEPA
jgi:RNA polymerase-binding transcription factor DksA